jgi:hypothetical protein
MCSSIRNLILVNKPPSVVPIGLLFATVYGSAKYPFYKNYCDKGYENTVMNKVPGPGKMPEHLPVLFVLSLLNFYFKFYISY